MIERVDMLHYVIEYGQSLKLFWSSGISNMN